MPQDEHTKAKRRQTIIKKYRLDGMTDEQAWQAYINHMKELGRTANHHTGHTFAHGKTDPSEAGKKGAIKRHAK